MNSTISPLPARPTAPEGWRFLSEEEPVREGDQYFDPHLQKFFPSHNWVSGVQGPRVCKFYIRREGRA